GVFGDSQFTSTLSVNFHFPKIPRRTVFFAPRRRFCAIFSPTCTCLDFAQQSIRFLLIQPPGI
ncbi:hypothetical protein, partial [Aeromonas sp. QDB14]|uniref:hypothetical protein n=1 Tax=Aeromonas sp. QDB14 TaxID=2989836 RepID=UPI0022E8AB97